MADRQVGMTTVVSGVLWALGVAVVIFGVAFRIYGVPAFGLLLAGIGGVLNIKGFIAQIEDRMHSMFECGRDYERSHGTKVRSMR